MGLFSWIGAAFGREQPPQPQASLTGNLTWDQVYQQVGQATSAAGVHVSVRSAEQLSAVWSCVAVAANDVASLPFILYRRLPDGSSEIATDDPRYQMVKSAPNSWQTAYEFRQQMQRDLELRGNAYARKIRNRARVVVELIRLHPDAVFVEQDATTLRLRYTYTSPSGGVVTLDQADVLHLRGMSDDGIVGLNPIAVHRKTFGEGIAMLNTAISSYANGAKPSGILSHPAEIKPDAKTQLRNDFEALLSGENAYKTAVLDKGLTYQPVQIKLADQQYIETRGFNRSEIAGIYQIPPHRIGDLTRATFSNIEHQSLEYVTYSLNPRLVRWEQALWRDVLERDPSYYYKANVDALLRGDAKSRSEALQIQRRNGIISANEWRELEDMPPRTDEGGDGYIVEANMRPDDGRDPAAAGGAQ